MQKRKHTFLKQRKTIVGASRRNILLRKARRKILNRNHAFFLTTQPQQDVAV